MINVWINNGSDWNVGLTESQYINVSTYRPFSGSYYINLPIEVRNSKKGLNTLIL